MEALKPTRHLFLILFFNTINVLCEKDIEKTPAEIWQSQHLTLKHQKAFISNSVGLLSCSNLHVVKSDGFKASESSQYQHLKCYNENSEYKPMESTWMITDSPSQVFKPRWVFLNGETGVSSWLGLTSGLWNLGTCRFCVSLLVRCLFWRCSHPQTALYSSFIFYRFWYRTLCFCCSWRKCTLAQRWCFKDFGRDKDENSNWLQISFFLPHIILVFLPSLLIFMFLWLRTQSKISELVLFKVIYKFKGTNKSERTNKGHILCKINDSSVQYKLIWIFVFAENEWKATRFLVLELYLLTETFCTEWVNNVFDKA